MKLLARVFAAAVACATVALPLVAAEAPSASAAPTWAPAATAPIHPGVQTFTAGAQCTANFIFFDASNTVYIGQAAHCSGTGGNTATNGCTSGSLPIGTQVQVTGASQPGTMVYNSWLTMQGLGEADANTCQFNDLALIKLNPADFGKVNPSIPFWGGPNGIDNNGTVQGENVYSYGNSELRGGVSQLSPKQGVSLGDAGGGWSHNVYTASPGIPGDSGSAFLNSTGAALGILSTVQIAPVAGSNGVGDVSREISYMNAHSSLGAQLALGTQPFNPNLAANLLASLGL
ncbi:MAG TPA: serine protease [Acidimicrobiia bacterium]|nr:serine protease [Acidimicrobiia bacterium]